MLQAGCMFPQYFNPRTPYGMRLDIFSFRKRSSNFNPRTPYGMRHFHYIEGGRHIVISIHAPLTGCDLRFVSYVHLAFYFNPRTPYGMRLPLTKTKTYEYGISIHAPLTGCDVADKTGWHGKRISIHAPLTGCDLLSVSIPESSHDFNPRSPYGMRQLVSSLRSTSWSFQSTHPLRDATFPPTCRRYSIRISIHAPLTGCDSGGTTVIPVYIISIHAPLTGCDWMEISHSCAI